MIYIILAKVEEHKKRAAKQPPFFFLSGKRDSDPRPRPWQGRALPTELFPQMDCKYSMQKPILQTQTSNFSPQTRFNGLIIILIAFESRAACLVLPSGSGYPHPDLQFDHVSVSIRDHQAGKSSSADPPGRWQCLLRVC